MMKRMPLLLLALCFAWAGCNKKDQNPVVVLEDPAPKKKDEPAAPKVAEGKKEPEKKDGPRVALAPLDLRPYGLFAQIDAPADTIVIPNLTGEIALSGPDGYSLSIRPGSDDMTRVKSSIDIETDATVLVDEPNAVLGRFTDGGQTFYRLAVNVSVGMKPYHVSRLLEPPTTEGQARRNLQAARSLIQTPALAKAQTEHDEAVETLARFGLNLNRAPDGTGQLIGLGPSPLQDKDLELLRHLPELSLVVLRVDAPLTAAALEPIRNLPRLRSLVLGGPWVDRTVVRGVAPMGDLKSLGIVAAPVNGGDLEPLAALKGLERLELSHVRLGDGGFKSFADFKALKTLNLAGTDVGDKSIAIINGMPGLRDLTLSDTAVTDAGIAELSLPELRRLDVSETVLTDAAIEKIAAFPNLEKANLYGTATTAAGIAGLRQLLPRVQFETPWPIEEPAPAVVKPPVALADLPAADPAALIKKFNAKVTRDEEVLGKPIITIDFQGTRVTDRDLAELRDFSQLRKLDLGDCVGITDAGLPYLADLRSLDDLNLRGTRVAGDGLVHLKGLQKLTRLALPAGVSLTSKQLEPISKLPAVESVTFQFPSNDHPVLAMVGRMPGLKELILDSASLTNRKMQYVAGLKNLETLALGRLGEWSDRGLAVVKDMPEMKNLFVHNYRGSNAGLGVIKNLSKLEALELSGPLIADSSLEGLGALGELKSLRLDGLRIGDQSMARLKPLEKLIDVSLQRTDVGDKGLEALGTLKALEVIDLAGTKVTDSGLGQLKELEELRTLRLDGTLVNGSGFKDLADLPRLYRLHLVGTKVTDKEMPTIAQLRPLQSLDLSRTAITSEGVAALKALPNLRDLNLNGCAKVGDDVKYTLPKFRSLKSLMTLGTGLSKAALDDIRKAGIAVNGQIDLSLP